VILEFAGSLRKGSFNKALLRAAVELCPPSARIVPHVIGDLPLYDATWTATRSLRPLRG
jgi:chromate reductase, NAD(P)H dehydrogenase (quinone)